MLDIVAARTAASVSVIDAGISDHHLIRWPVPMDQPTVQSVSVRSRPWRRLDLNLFRTELSTSVLCTPNLWPDDVDAAA